MAAITMIAIAAPAQAQAATPTDTAAYQPATAWAPAAPAYYQRAAYNFWKAFECTVGVGIFIAGNAYLVLKIKRFGGVVKFAKQLWRAKSTEERAKIVGRVLGYIGGTEALIKVCTP